MPAFFRVDISGAQLYFDNNYLRCCPPGSRPFGQNNTIYFVLEKTGYPLIQTTWDAGLIAFSSSERRLGLLWNKDIQYEKNVAPSPAVRQKKEPPVEHR